jgi:hypothetical protein
MDHESVGLRFRSLSSFLNERMRRLVAAAESAAIGYGGVSLVARATGVSRRAITEGMKELSQQKVLAEPVPSQSRIRRKGAGRKRTVDKDPRIRGDLDRLVDPATRGDPESPLRWTCKSVRMLAEELQREGHSVSHQTVAELLHEMDYSLQANQKKLEGSRHADRNQQFEYINRKAQRYLKQGEPVISVDTKKKELVGDFKNPGREWQPQGEPEKVGVHDFEIRRAENGKVAPTASMTLDGTLGGSVWEWITTRRSSPSRAYAGGGVGWAAAVIRKRSVC